jgi:hypothetical protein
MKVVTSSFLVLLAHLWLVLKVAIYPHWVLMERLIYEISKHNCDNHCNIVGGSR